MHLKVVHRAGLRYRGTHYAPGEALEIDEFGHNGAAEIRYLKALKKVEEAPAAPVGKVSETKPAERQAPEPAPEPAPAAAEEADEPEADDEAPSRRRGRYNRRDIRAED